MWDMFDTGMFDPETDVSENGVYIHIYTYKIGVFVNGKMVID